MPCDSVALRRLASVSKSPICVLYEIVTYADKCYLMCNIMIRQEISVLVTGYTEKHEFQALAATTDYFCDLLQIV